MTGTTAGRVIVVGAGVSGLSAAYRLQQQGFRFGRCLCLGRATTSSMSPSWQRPAQKPWLKELKESHLVICFSKMYAPTANGS